MTEREIFTAALREPDPTARAVLLDRACADDCELRERIESLLGEHDQLGSFLEQPAGEMGAAGTHTLSFGGETASASRETPGSIIGPYKLVERIGEGGMGDVWMAQQTEPVKRIVAVKLIKPGMDSRAILARFEAERQALALMDHPNIARVLDAGATADGRPYFVMELVKGTPITKFCDGRHLTPRQRLELFVPVCQAIQHAHQKGIIHRDIKPSNVLVTLYDDKPVPKVIDFGVAKATGQQLTESSLHTGFGAVVGTPEYMSPEQAGFSQLDVDTRSDIYSLGVLLYELLTGSPPFSRKDLERAGMLEMLRVIREQEPSKPSTKLSTADGLPTLAANRSTEPKRLKKLVRGELDWIVMKALEKDRSRRYETANSFGADVQRYLNDEPVQACPPSAGYRFRKFAQRNRGVIATAFGIAVAVVVAVAALAVSTVLIARALRSETDAKSQLAANLKRERQDSYFTRIGLAHRELLADNLGGALQLLNDCPDELRDWEWRYVSRLCYVDPLVVREKNWVNSIVFSTDGKRLATADSDGAVRIRDAFTCRVVQTLPTDGGYVRSLAYHRDGRHVASVGADGLVKVWDLMTGEKVFAAPCDGMHLVGTGYGVAFSPDGRQLAAGSNGAMNVWDWTSRSEKPLHSFTGLEKRAISVAYSPDGRRLATGTWGGRLTLWDPVAGGDKPVCIFPEASAARHPVAALAFSPDGRLLASASFERRVDVWDTTTGEHVHTLRHTGLVVCVAFSPDGLRLVSAGEDKFVRVWDVATGREVLGLRGHTALCGCVAFSPDGLRLVSGSLDRTIHVWDATPLRGDEHQEIRSFSHPNEVWSLAISPDSSDGPKILVGGWGVPARVWDLGTGQIGTRVQGHLDNVFSVAWRPDGTQFASAGRDGDQFTVRVWDAQTGKEVFAPLPAGREYMSVAYSHDGRYLVTGRANGQVQVWDANTGRPVVTLGNHGLASIRWVEFSTDGTLLVSASVDGNVKLWDGLHLDKLQNARHTFTTQISGPNFRVAFSPDGRWLAAGCEKHMVRIWDVETYKVFRVLRGHSGDVHAVAFSPDSRWIASAGEDSTVKVWDMQTGELVRSFRGHTGLVTSLTFTADGRSLVSGSRDHKVKVWDVTKLDDVTNR